MRGTVFVVSGPSGAGKTSILREVLRRIPNLEFSVSYTTRPKRPGEKDGEDYFFVSEEKFKELINADEFLEWAEVHGYLYGTSKGFVSERVKQGVNLILDIDVQGALAVMKEMPEVATVFISPPSFEELKKRLLTRGTENERDLKRRLEDARWEFSHIVDFQYLVVNRNLKESAKQLEAVIIAEQLRLDRIKDHMGLEEIFRGV
ncbi:MAG: guanylate kinase [Thermotogae bacterium]|uniref:Guanylate kinase n=1 Tax=Kosmotoga arenicorallina TaxID=688066 RepID=A0A7C5HXR8_9BACT|nr:guanylate kinase [Kosmotoga sp.]MBO8167160.1 guanylate kinase [Kosmotoga sp.]RKX50055.1 MAG: guanylate kinase [Thermotogota bacterium]HHF08751.1 guanylate kinase [Kosmotoga arenicorallina]